MNKKICLLFAVASSAFLSAQSIEGTITNTSHQPAADTEVLVTKENSKYLPLPMKKENLKFH